MGFLSWRFVELLSGTVFEMRGAGFGDTLFGTISRDNSQIETSLPIFENLEEM